DGFGELSLVDGRARRGEGAGLTVGKELTVGVGPGNDDVRAARVDHGPALGDEAFEAVPHGPRELAGVALGQPVGLARVAGPVAELGVLVVSVRPHDGDATGLRGRVRRGAAAVVGHEAALEREDAVVGEEYEAAARDLEVEVDVGGGVDDL